jgi:glycine cleavage system H protein
VKEVNSALAETPELINSEPHGKAWMMKVALSQPPAGDLLTAEQYDAYLKEEEG